jgi:pimeloyl-ACP methyl ester carboxylesterase
VRRHEFISTLMPRAELQVIEGAGHLPMLERPSAVTQALREWLDRPLLLR